MDVLVTDKTGTLTTGEFTVSDVPSPSVDWTSSSCGSGRCWSRAPDRASWDDAPVGDPVAAALWSASADARERLATQHVLDDLPFDHDRRRASVLVDASRPERGRRAARLSPVLVTTGAPASRSRRAKVAARCRFACGRPHRSGCRVIAVAFRSVLHSGIGPGHSWAADESGLTLAGFVSFDDPLKPGVHEAAGPARPARRRVVVASGDSAQAVQAARGPCAASERAESSATSRSTPSTKLAGRRGRERHPVRAGQPCAEGACRGDNA